MGAEETRVPPVFEVQDAEQALLLVLTPNNTYNLVLGSFFVQFQKFTEG